MISRPIGYEHETRDCVVRAVAIAAGIDYEIAHKICKQNGRKDKHGMPISNNNKMAHIVGKLFRECGIKCRMVKRSGSAEKLAKQYPQGNLFCVKRGHAFNIIDGEIVDCKKSKSHIIGAWLMGEVIGEPKIKK